MQFRDRKTRPSPVQPPARRSGDAAPERERKVSPRGLAARAGRWSATHRKTAIALWFAFVAMSIVVGGQVERKDIKDIDYFNGESRVAEQALAKHLPKPLAQENVIVSSRGLRAGDVAFDRAVEDVRRRVASAPSVTGVRGPNVREGTISPDSHAALVSFVISGDKDSAADRVAPIRERLDAARVANPAVEIGQTGDASIEHELEGAFNDDLIRARNLSLPITLGILLLAFGALVAAGIPVLLAITGVIATIGLVSLPSQLSPVDDAIAEVILLIGMAVGVDYSLFYLKREREERAAGRGPRAALEAAAATSGRAVLVSGLTVIAAMAGMLMAGDKTFISFGVGTMMVVAVAMIGSLTVLPAMLSLLGDRVEKGRVPLLGRLRARRETAGGGGVWTAVVTRVLRRPAVFATAAIVLLLALATPALELKTQQASVDDFPQRLSSIQAYRDVERAFPSENLPAVVVYQNAAVRGDRSKAAIAEFSTRVADEPGMYAPSEIVYSKDGRLARISVPLTNARNQEAAENTVKHLRNTVLPETLGAVPGARASVTGMTAQSVDFNKQMQSRLPVVFGFVLGLSFLLMLVTFRSIVIPLKAIVLNLLSVGAAYGVLVLMFQHGWGADLLNFDPSGAIAPWLPLFLFVILFGLSMDYHVFILSRVRELVDRGMDTESAVAGGIRQTAGVVTSAAAVMVAVFAIFGSLSMLPLKQMGVGLSVAVLIDATIIRAVLLPAAMKLLGDWNWYLPRWLEWLPSARGEGARPAVGVMPEGEGVAVEPTPA